MGRLEILCTRFRHTPFRSTAGSLVRTITFVFVSSRHIFTRLRGRQEIRIHSSHSVTRKTRKKRALSKISPSRLIKASVRSCSFCPSSIARLPPVFVNVSFSHLRLSNALCTRPFCVFPPSPSPYPPIICPSSLSEFR